MARVETLEIIDEVAQLADRRAAENALALLAGLGTTEAIERLVEYALGESELLRAEAVKRIAQLPASSIDLVRQSLTGRLTIEGQSAAAYALLGRLADLGVDIRLPALGGATRWKLAASLFPERRASAPRLASSTTSLVAGLTTFLIGLGIVMLAFPAIVPAVLQGEGGAGTIGDIAVILTTAVGGSVLLALFAARAAAPFNLYPDQQAGALVEMLRPIRSLFWPIPSLPLALLAMFVLLEDAWRAPVMLWGLGLPAGLIACRGGTLLAYESWTLNPRWNWITSVTAGGMFGAIVSWGLLRLVFRVEGSQGSMLLTDAALLLLWFGIAGVFAWRDEPRAPRAPLLGRTSLPVLLGSALVPLALLVRTDAAACAAPSDPSPEQDSVRVPFCVLPFEGTIGVPERAAGLIVTSADYEDLAGVLEGKDVVLEIAGPDSVFAYDDPPESAVLRLCADGGVVAASDSVACPGERKRAPNAKVTVLVRAYNDSDRPSLRHLRSILRMQTPSSEPSYLTAVFLDSASMRMRAEAVALEQLLDSLAAGSFADSTRDRLRSRLASGWPERPEFERALTPAVRNSWCWFSTAVRDYSAPDPLTDRICEGLGNDPSPSGDALDTRAVHRAFAGDTSGARADLERALEDPLFGPEEIRKGRAQWLAELRAGRNPFATAEQRLGLSCRIVTHRGCPTNP
jgi:hypothetical protein